MSLLVRELSPGLFCSTGGGYGCWRHVGRGGAALTGGGWDEGEGSDWGDGRAIDLTSGCWDGGVG